MYIFKVVPFGNCRPKILLSENFVLLVSRYVAREGFYFPRIEEAGM